MHFARWITKVTDTHSEYVVFLAFAQLQWLLEPAVTLLLYAILCLVIYVLQTGLVQGPTFFGFLHLVLLTFGKIPCP